MKLAQTMYITLMLGSALPQRRILFSDDIAEEGVRLVVMSVEYVTHG